MLRKTSLVAAALAVVGSGAIVAGQFVAVSLQKNGIHTCSGSIINTYWTLSRGSCVDSPIEVLAGTRDLDEGGTRHSVTDIIVHEDYDPSASINDIALFKVMPSFPTTYLTTGLLPAQGEQVLYGVPVTIYGWSSLLGQGLSLLNVNTHTINQEECEAAWAPVGYAIPPTEICAARLEDQNYGSCIGDSGGPMLYEGKIVGMASRGHECAIHHTPGTYTRVSNYANWINEKISG